MELNIMFSLLEHNIIVNLSTAPLNVCPQSEPSCKTSIVSITWLHHFESWPQGLRLTPHRTPRRKKLHKPARFWFKILCDRCPNLNRNTVTSGAVLRQKWHQGSVDSISARGMNSCASHLSFSRVTPREKNL